jgi:hypothetical protein
MAGIIVHHKGLFFEFSTVSDAPSSPVMPRQEFEAWFQAEYGRSAMDGLDRRMERAIRKGTSSLNDDSAYDTVRGNRAGPREGTLSLKRILEEYRADPAPTDTFGAHIVEGTIGRIGDRQIGPGHVVLSEARYRWLFERASLPVENLPEVTA